jgi:hypothetical protein
MKIHLAYENTDADLDLIPTHREIPIKKVSSEGEKIINQRYIIYDIYKRKDILLKEENLFEKLKDTDEEIDIELTGKYIKSTNRITVNKNFEPVYNYRMYDVLYQPDGSIKERVHQQTVGNINHATPVRITDDLHDKKALIRRYIFRKSYNITHSNGLTFKFLYDIAKKLHDVGKFARVETFDPKTKKRAPLILYDGGRKFPRAFLEGKIKENSYCLMLHVSDQEFIIPKEQELEGE